MITYKKGLIAGPIVRRHASKILKREVETEEGIDSDTTIIVARLRDATTLTKNYPNYG